jgi:hypothetical protein
MLITILAPEIMFGKALAELMAARQDKKAMKDLAREDGVEWDLYHTFFANMGGFTTKPEVISTPGGESQIASVEVSVSVLGHTLQHMRVEHHISRLPAITSVAIYDKSKASLFIKFLAAAQILSNIVQLVVRAINKNDIALIEIATSAFSACAIVIYSLLMHKPQKVRVPLQLVPASATLLSTICHENASVAIRPRRWVGRENMDEDVGSWEVVPNDIVIRGRHNINFETGVVFRAVVVGAIHCCAWYLPFPTHAEKLTWRTCSIFITISTPFVFLPSLGAHLIKEGSLLQKVVFERLFALNYVAGCLYVLARLFLLLECVRQLFFQPPGAYVSTTWPAFLPNVE